MPGANGCRSGLLLLRQDVIESTVAAVSCSSREKRCPQAGVLQFSNKIRIVLTNHPNLKYYWLTPLRLQRCIALFAAQLCHVRILEYLSAAAGGLEPNRPRGIQRSCCIYICKRCRLPTGPHNSLAGALKFRLYLGTWPEWSKWCNRPFGYMSMVGFCFKARDSIIVTNDASIES